MKIYENFIRTEIFRGEFWNNINRSGFGFAYYLRSDCRSVIHNRISGSLSGKGFGKIHLIEIGNKKDSRKIFLK